MSIFDKIHNKLDDVLTDFVFNVNDKLEDSLDLMDRRMQRRFKKLEEKEDKFNALFGLEDFKNTSMKYRTNTVFSKNKPIEKTYAEYGDIIGVDRGIYKHYGIYIGNDRVIHYAGENEDFSLKDLKNNTIREDGMSRFLLKSKEYFVLDCETVSGLALPILGGKKLLVAYSSEETVLRAKSKLGENKYSLALNNCEHFAIWCKTGIHKSNQVDTVLRVLTRVPLVIKTP